MNRGCRVGAALLALAASTAACEASRVAPDADVAVSGHVRTPDGGPAAGRPVVLLAEASVGEALVGLPFVLGTLGLVCVVEDAPAPCDDAGRRTTTDDDGAYRFDLKGSDTHDLFGGASRLELASGLPPALDELDGPSASARFLVQTETVTLPDLRMWRPVLELASTGAIGTVGWATPPDAFPVTSGYTTVFDRGPEATVWAVDGPAAPASFDVRVLEDSTGGLSVVAESDVGIDGADLTIAVRSARQPYYGAAGAPPSRGRPCRLAGADGALVARAPCWLTDGDLAAPSPPEATPTGQATAAVVDLTPAPDVSLVVVRGCTSGCRVETSVDGATWQVLGDAFAPFAVFPVEPPRAAAHVRVAGDDVAALSEVSAWTGPFVPPVELQGRPAFGSPPPAHYSRDDGDDGGLTVPALVAGGVALLAAGAAAGVALSRRRGRGTS